MRVLKIGDTVLWHGGFGAQPAVPAKVVGIEVTRCPREKYGTEVDEVQWSVVEADRACPSLDNGHWCYGSQVQEVRS